MNEDNHGLEGTLPEELGTLTMLENLIVKNHPRLVGQIPMSIGRLQVLGQLGLHNNALTGGIPHELYDSTQLNYINLQNNQLEGGLILRIENLKNLEKLILFNNKFSGGVPIRQLAQTGIQYLGLSNNKFSGSIIDQIESLQMLEYLYLDNNALTGTIPKTIGRLTNMSKCIEHPLTFACHTSHVLHSVSFNLDMNRFTGSIPSELGGMKNLEYASAQNNSLAGRIPTEISRLGNLCKFVLDSKPSLLSCETHYSFLFVVVLNFGTNALTGQVPDLSNLKNLKQLHFFQNRLTGSLPSWMGRMSSLGT